MLFVTTSLSTPAENLALEEAWLELAEQGQWSDEVLRVWQPDSRFVVIGRGSKAAGEVNLPALQHSNVPLLRRMSGGAAIVAAPGCLMYALLLSYENRPHFRMLDQVHKGVMDTLANALKPLAPGLDWDGTCDLVVNQRKVSGNSLRCRRDWLVYHGTILLNMDLTLADQLLLHPPREPEYRQHRQHTDFIANLNLPAEIVIEQIRQAWRAEHKPVPIPSQHVERLVRERYSTAAWNYQR